MILQYIKHDDLAKLDLLAGHQASKSAIFNTNARIIDFGYKFFKQLNYFGLLILNIQNEDLIFTES